MRTFMLELLSLPVDGLAAAVQAGRANARRYACGDDRTVWENCARNDAAEPKPERSAMTSTGSVVVSSSACAAATRWWMSHRWGVVPVAAANRREKVRLLIIERSASIVNVSGSSRCR